MNHRKRKLTYAAAGALLGLGSPLGALALRWLAQGAPDLEGASWLVQEIASHRFFYLYQAVGTVLVFTLSGLWAGRTCDCLDDLSERLEEMSLQDPLTRLYNRRSLEMRLNEEAARAARFGFPLACMMIDIDFFKSINDRCGHPAGDEVLRQLAAQLHDASREGDVVGRLGGDEFLIILPRTNLALAGEVGERIRRAVAGFGFAAGSRRLNVTVSIGAAECPQGAFDPRELIQTADRALYAAKTRGRDCVILIPGGSGAPPAACPT